MPHLATALSITNMMNPNLFFLPSLWKLLTGDLLVDLFNLGEESLLLNQSGRTSLGGRRRGSGGRPRRNAAETRLAMRKRRAAGTAPGTSALRMVRSTPRWISRRGPAKLACTSQVPSRYPPPPSFSSHPSPSPHGKFRMENSERRQTFLFLSFFLPSQSVENTF